MADFILDDEFRRFLPKLRKRELDALTEMIVSGKHVEKLVVAVIAGVKILLDGYNRYDICIAADPKIPYEVREIEFEDRAEAMRWMAKNQLARRSHTPAIKALAIGKVYNEAKGERGEKTGVDAAAAVAAENGVSKRTVQLAGKFVKDFEAQPEEVQEQIADGDLPMTAAVVVYCQGCFKKKNFDGIGSLPAECEECDRVRAAGMTQDAVGKEFAAKTFGFLSKPPENARLAAREPKPTKKTKPRKPTDANVDQAIIAVRCQALASVLEHLAELAVAEDHEWYTNLESRIQSFPTS